MTKLYSETFSISYDDEHGDYSCHIIAADVLGKAITGVSDAIEAVNKELGKETLELKVTTPAKEGSVMVVFLAVATSPNALAALQVLGITTVVGAVATASVIETVKQLKGKRVTRIEIDETADTAIIEAEGEPPVKTSATVGKMAVDKKIRTAIHDFVQAPIAGNPTGIVKVLDKKENPQITFKASEAMSFNPLPEGSLETVESERIETTCNFTQVNFESTKGWRVKLGTGEEHSVELIDDVFMDQVKQNQKSFTKDDLFGITLQINGVKRQSGRSTYNYTVIKVTHHYAHDENKII